MDTARRPAPWSAYTTPEFWNDPHISAQMLRHHLDPETAAASRRHAFIDRSAEWIASELGLCPGSRVLDLGCGPGLYAARLARRGIAVTGVDVSERSLAHARATAEREDLPIHLIRGSYLESELGSGYEAAILIYEDYCVLSPEQRAALLGRVRDALRPGGRFLVDVTSAPRFAEIGQARREGIQHENEFWAPPPYHLVHETWTYPAERLVLNRYVVAKDGATREFWNWMQCLSPDEVASEFAEACLAVVDLNGDVAGAPYDPASPTFAVTADRQSP